MSGLTGLSFAYPDVPAPARARLMNPRLGAEDSDIFFLSTCLRVEFAYSGDPEMAPELLRRLYGGRFLPAARMRTGLEAFQHLSRVAAGLESAQTGETEVLTQFRQALGRFAEGANGSPLTRVLETATGVARIARRSLGVERRGSLAAAAAAMAGVGDTVAILGGGAMARAVAHHLDTRDVTAFARGPGTLAGIETRPWAELGEALSTAEVVVSTVPGPVPLLDASAFEVLRARPVPLLFVDLGMPSAISADSSPGIAYRDVDDVAAVVDTTPEPEAEDVMDRESAAAWRRLSVSPRAGSIITSVVDRAAHTVDEEVGRYVSRLRAAEDPEVVLRQLARTVARRIIHPSVAFVGSTPLDADQLDVVARVFGVDE